MRFSVSREASILDERGVLTRPGEFASLLVHDAAAVRAETTVGSRKLVALVVGGKGSARLDDDVLIAAAAPALTACLLSVPGAKP